MKESGRILDKAAFYGTKAQRLKDKGQRIKAKSIVQSGTLAAFVESDLSRDTLCAQRLYWS